MKTGQEIDILDSTSIERAREIMGRNLISPLQTETYLMGHNFFGHNRFKTVPFSESFLREKSQNHILIRGIGLTTEEIYKQAVKKDPHLHNIFGDMWFITERFARYEKVQSGWYLMQKRVNPLSLKIFYDKAKTLIDENEEIPKACELFYTVLLYYLTTHKRLFRGYYPFSQDVFLGNNLLVGFFPKDSGSHQYQLDIRHYADNLHSRNTGIVSIKK